MGTKDVASEHLLIGLLRQVQDQRMQEHSGQVWPPAPSDRVEAANAASHVLGELGLALDTVRADVERQRPRPASLADGDARLASDTKQVIYLSYKEARRFSVAHIGTEHLLLGLIQEEKGLAGRMLAQYGADPDQVRFCIDGLSRTDSVREMPGFWRRFCEIFAPRA